MIAKPEIKNNRRPVIRSVEYRPIYTIRTAASALELSESKIKEMIKQNKIGWFSIGTKKGRWGSFPIIRITGQQLIAFIGQLESGEVSIYD